MKKLSYIIVICILFISCKEKESNTTNDSLLNTTNTTANTPIKVTSFKGQQVTGVTVSNKGRIFVNFPRWRKGVTNSVVEISGNNHSPFPNKEWNSWKIGDPVSPNKFVGVQSVVASNDFLYVLDTRSPLFQEVLDAPRVFVFNIKTKNLEHAYILNNGTYHPNSYINDLRVDHKKNKIYFTDSGNSGLVILDLKTEKFTRVLDNHSSTKAEVDFLTFNSKKWTNTVHSDGIALDTKNDKLYYHALTGYSLYSIPTAALTLKDSIALEKEVTFEAKTSAPDGMIFDNKGYLYYADLENDKIMYRKPDGSTYILLEGDAVKWADTFSIYNNYLYYTNSRINEVSADISAMNFTVYKIKLPK
ncbi:major royal jelly protein [Cellulophaga sp. RHA_52]|uniref:L-dopachrome tautomerase-related protein n=1 Tax=Cellulophaga sp. RHA_52 TaxID=1250036 RepID=UPI00119C24A9|nr:L-dopachrome tautomerase-related protein [Cellulophaga sp. RHA_52]TVZ09222.1 major royal jelly protein [Cellulophaga sp. RHA_52]